MISGKASGISPADMPQVGWWTQQTAFTWKELCETLRDRRTTVTLIVMPVLLYPLVGLMFRFVAVGEASQRAPKYRVVAATEQEAAWLSSVIQAGNQILAAPSTSALSSEIGEDVTNPEPEVEFLVPDQGIPFDLQEMVADGSADLGFRVAFTERQISERFPGADLQLFQVSDSSVSRDAAAYLRQRLLAANLLTATSTIRQSGINFDVPVRESTHYLRSSNRTSAILGLLPLVLLLMTVTGGVYPAIDLTAGERERETLETLMAMPVPRVRLLMAKYIAVLTVTLLTGIMNILAMSVTVYAMQMEESLFGEAGLTLSLIGRLFSMLFVFSLFYSAILLLVTSSARSFKEAQALLIPLMLMTIAPGLVIMLPGWKLEGWLIVVPLVNMLLMARELLEGTLTTVPAMIAVASTLLFSGAALSIAARCFGTDVVLTGSRFGWRDFFRRPQMSSAIPGAVVGLTTLALLFPGHFLASGFLARISGADTSLRLTLSGILTVVLFAALPLFLLRWFRISWKSVITTTFPSMRLCCGVILLAASVWPWIYELVVILQSAGVHSLDEAKQQQVMELLTAWRKVSPALVILCLGIIPGICEELFFRGFLMSSLRREMNAGSAVVISAVCFGLFHVVLAGDAAPERLIPSSMMGLLLGWIAWRSGSVVPAMMLHVIHNSTLLLIAQWNQELSNWVAGSRHQTHLPAAWLFASAIGVIAGFSISAATTRRPR